MKFWKTTIVFTIYKNKPPNIYTLHTNDIATIKDVTKYWRNIFDYMGKNGIYKIVTEEITKEEWLDYWRRAGYEKPYGIE